MDVLFGDIFVFQFARHEKSWKNTIWWSPCSKYLLLLAKCWYTDTQFLEPGGCLKDILCTISWNAMESPNPFGPGVQVLPASFQLDLGTWFTTCLVFHSKNLGLEGWTILALKNALHLSRVLMNWRCWNIHLTQIAIYLVCVYIYRLRMITAYILYSCTVFP